LNIHIVLNQATDPIKRNEDRPDMKNARFIKSVIKSAASESPQMPWARGKRRTAFIAKRKGAVSLAKSA